MALLDDVKSELAAIDNELPIAKKAQATAMIRFGNGLHSVDHHILVQAQLDSQDAAIWLQDTIRNLYGHEATLTPVSRQTPTGVVQRFIVRVPKAARLWCCRPACTAVTPKTWCWVCRATSSTARSPRSRPPGVARSSQADTCPTRARPAISKSYVRIMSRAGAGLHRASSRHHRQAA